jgi:F-type H+-transporting ATPase subunit alpha
MIDAEHAVRETAARIPVELSARFETANKLSDEDRKAVTELARQALVRFQPTPADNGAPTVKPKS